MVMACFTASICPPFWIPVLAWLDCSCHRSSVSGGRSISGQVSARCQRSSRPLGPWACSSTTAFTRNGTCLANSTSCAASRCRIRETCSVSCEGCRGRTSPRAQRSRGPLAACADLPRDGATTAHGAPVARTVQPGEHGDPEWRADRCCEACHDHSLEVLSADRCSCSRTPHLSPPLYRDAACGRLRRP